MNYNKHHFHSFLLQLEKLHYITNLLIFFHPYILMIRHAFSYSTESCMFAKFRLCYFLLIFFIFVNDFHRFRANIPKKIIAVLITSCASRFFMLIRLCLTPWASLFMLRISAIDCNIVSNPESNLLIRSPKPFCVFIL